jgi:hypothetical protein
MTPNLPLLLNNSLYFQYFFSSSRGELVLFSWHGQLVAVYGSRIKAELKAGKLDLSPFLITN